MVKSADTADLKSADPRRSWGFKSPSGHHESVICKDSRFFLSCPFMLVPLLVPLGGGDLGRCQNRRQRRKLRGVFQRPPGSGIWWISYKQGSVRMWEKVGRKNDAITLYQKRRTELLSGRKLPENLRRSPLTFAQIAEYSRTHHTDMRNVTQRLRRIVESFGDRRAEQIRPAEIDE